MTHPQDPSQTDPVAQLLTEGEAFDDLESGMPFYERALALDPDRAATHYNIGLVYKYRGAWPESLHHNRRASDLRADDEAAHWNMGIAATALRDWPSAREAWRRAGIGIPEGEGPIDSNFGLTPVRLNPDDHGEVVWARRIDPVRAVIQSVPYPDSGFREGDMVLHDGAAVGRREQNGRSYPVFNVLELFEPSANSTFEAEIRARDAADLEALEAALEAANVTFEVWTTNIEILCKQCSEGTPHEHTKEQEVAQATAWPDSHVLGISATSPEAARAVLERWSEGAGDERLVRFECVLAGSEVH